MPGDRWPTGVEDGVEVAITRADPAARLLEFVRRVGALTGPCIERPEGCQHTVCKYIREARRLVSEVAGNA